MVQFGWALFFDKDYIQCFKQVEPLLINGLRFASKQESIGMACVVGPADDCLRLKQQIKEMGIGEMIPNTDCIRPI